MNGRAQIETALTVARQWHEALPAVRAFCPWPDDLTWAPRAPHRLGATDLVKTRAGAPNGRSTALLEALQTAADHVEWRHTYTEEEVGRHFLDNFCWFELAGPTGHFLTKKTRITIGYWGPGLNYGRHQHVAEELYTVVSGKAVFHADGEPDAELGPTQTRYHASNQPHAMTTETSPVLTLVFWRGNGLGDPPRMSS